MLPQREWRIAVENHTRYGLNEERQQMAKHFGWRRNYAIGRQEGPQHMRVAQGVGKHKLRQDPCWQAQIDADRKGVPAAHAAAGTDDEPVVDEGFPNRLD